MQFQTLSTTDMAAYIDRQYPMLPNRDVVVMLAQGRPGLVALFVDLLDTIPSAFVVLEYILKS